MTIYESLIIMDMTAPNKPEVWLRGPVTGIQPALQPVAHALLQVREELVQLMDCFDDALLWQKPAGAASAGFHLQHLAGVLDRLFTYAKGQGLTAEQFDSLAAEGRSSGNSTASLVMQFSKAVDRALQQLRDTETADLFSARGVGRAQIPSTVMGLMVHAAEHSMRHLGQLLVTVQVLKSRVD